MPYIGNPIYQSAFVTDQFSGTGSQTAYTMSVSPAGTTNVLVVVSGVVQDPTTYGVVGTTLNFSAAPPSGTGNISCRYLGIPVTGVTTTAYRTVTEFTATASQTTFTPPSYNVGFINVYLNGVLLGSADYTATNGTTVVLATGASAGNLVTVESFQISSVANAIQNSAGSVSSSNIATGAVTPAKLSTGGPYWDTSSNLGVGVTPSTSNLATVQSPYGLLVGNNQTNILCNSYYNSGFKYVGTGYASHYRQLNGAHEWYTAASGTANNTTSFTQVMNIDASGRVTTPYQPSFYAMMNNTNYSGASYQTVIWEDVYVNVGSNYSASTGRFTAPIAGVYFFSWYLLQRYTGSGNTGLYKNGSYYGSGGSQTYTGHTANDETMISATVIISLSAGDYVEVKVSTSGATDFYGNSNCHNGFNGYLIG